MELLDVNIGFQRLHPPRVVMCSIALIQGDEKIAVGELNRDDLRCLSKMSLVAKPGPECVYKASPKNSPKKVRHG